MKRTTPLSRSPLRRVGKRGAAIREELDRVRPLVLARDGHRCRRCGKGGQLDVHHRKGRAQGGAHTLENTLALCRACHDAVGTMRAPDWLEWVEMRKGCAS